MLTNAKCIGVGYVPLKENIDVCYLILKDGILWYRMGGIAHLETKILILAYGTTAVLSEK